MDMVRKRLTVNLPADLLEQLRNTAYWNPGMTLAGLVERGIRVSIEDLERSRGGPFPIRLRELKGGRPRRRENGCESPQRSRYSAPRRFVPIQIGTVANCRYLY